jgi:hypothetical protein
MKPGKEMITQKLDVFALFDISVKSGQQFLASSLETITCHDRTCSKSEDR